MDYAILYWVRHFEAGITACEDEGDLIKELTESMEVFLQKHWASPSISSNVSKRNTDRLQCCQDAPFYDTLEQAVVATRKELTFYGKMKKEEIALNLGDTLQKVRRAMELILSQQPNRHMRSKLEEMYRTDFFKCSRFSCQFFSNGFLTSEERDRHVEKHDRPFRCTVEGCPTVIFGLKTARELEKHMKDTHGVQADQNLDFPTASDLRTRPEPKEPKKPTSLPEQPKIKLKKEFKCPNCSKIFLRNYNLQSHSLTHSGDRPYGCEVCGKTFARQNDCRRHRTTHGGARSFTCGGVLKNGSPWGCQKDFSRADTLSNHHKSMTGRACILPFLREQEQERDGCSLRLENTSSD
jgi:hypothetical protein